MELFEFAVLKIVATFLIITTLGVVTYYKWAFTYWKSRNIPYADPTIPFGNIPNPITNKLNIGIQIQQGYNILKSLGFKYAGLYLITVPKFVVVNPEMIKIVMQKDFAYFTDRGFYYNEKDDPLSANLFALGGKKWRSIRTKLSPAFTSGKLKVMFETLLKCCYQLKYAIDDVFKKWQEINVTDFSASYSVEVIGSCAFGLECNSFKNPNSEFKKEGKKIFDFSSYYRLIKVSFAFCWPTFARRLGVQLFDKKSIEFFTNVVKETIQFRQANKVYRNDIIQLLMELKMEDSINEENSASNNPFENESVLKELAAQVFIFFAAGFETSSTTLSYCLYELAVNPNIQQKVRSEINDVLAKHQENISYDSIMNMKYMDQVIEETLRKYPPVSYLTRLCVRDFKIPGTDSVIEKGIEVLVPVLGLHHDADYYPEPEKFDPERFNEKNKQQLLPFTYLPFGEGPRICIGLRFGLMQIKAALSILLQQYKFSVNKKTIEPIEFEHYSFTLIPKTGIYLNIEKIQN